MAVVSENHAPLQATPLQPTDCEELLGTKTIGRKMMASHHPIGFKYSYSVLSCISSLPAIKLLHTVYCIQISMGHAAWHNF